MKHLNINPGLICWACERSGLNLAKLEKRFPKLKGWREGTAQPTMRQLEELAKATLTPLGWFFLEVPPVEQLPMPDFRTVDNQPVHRPSAALLETIYTMQRRQDWLKEYLMEEGEPALSFIGSCTTQMEPTAVAETIRQTLGLTEGWSKDHPTWEAAFLALRRAAESVGIIVVINGIVGNNTHQPLRPEEFRGFVLCDTHAPFVFINGADAKSAQMFTLAHELAHLWLGKDGLFDLDPQNPSSHDMELFCNKVAAEMLVPRQELAQIWSKVANDDRPFASLAKHFKVSPIVAARRALYMGLINQTQFFDFWKKSREEASKEKQQRKRGGDFNKNQENRIGRRFGLSVMQAVREGKLLYRDAFKLTGLASKAFDKYAKKLV